ncbi:hypothetical protein LFL97_38575 (plasmid) [Burkholderia sp. JSH-S8]|nr:hypothetical protein LFL97_38575 [Burkholderia sp. JSH-S8]
MNKAAQLALVFLVCFATRAEARQDTARLPVSSCMAPLKCTQDSHPRQPDPGTLDDKAVEHLNNKVKEAASDNTVRSVAPPTSQEWLASYQRARQYRSPPTTASQAGTRSQ